MVFIHTVSNVKTSKLTQHQCNDVQLQTAPNKICRVVSFDPSLHTHMQHYKQLTTPVLLKNIIVKENEGDWLFNHQSTAYPFSNCHVPFECKQPNTYQLQKLLLNSSQQLIQTRKLMFLAYCPLGTKNQNNL